MPVCSVGDLLSTPAQTWQIFTWPCSSLKHPHATPPHWLDKFHPNTHPSFAFAYLQGSLVLNPHIICSETDNSMLGKGGETVTNQKILRSKPRSPFLAIWSAGRGGQSGLRGGSQCLETSPFRSSDSVGLPLVRRVCFQLNYCKWKLWTLGNGVSSATTVKDFAKTSTDNKWKWAQLGVHSVQAPCSQSKAVVLFCLNEVTG